MIETQEAGLGNNGILPTLSGPDALNNMQLCQTIAVELKR